MNGNEEEKMVIFWDCVGRCVHFFCVNSEQHNFADMEFLPLHCVTGIGDFGKFRNIFRMENETESEENIGDSVCGSDLGSCKKLNICKKNVLENGDDDNANRSHDLILLSYSHLL